MKLQPAVKRETINITFGVCGSGAIMLLVFTLLGRFDLSVLFGMIAGGMISIINFLLLGITVQKAAQSNSAKGTSLVRLSYSVRMLLLGVFIFITMRTPWLNSVSAVAPLFFPRTTIAFMNFTGYMGKRGEKHES